MSSIAERESAPLSAGEEIAQGLRVIAHLRRGNDLDVYDAWSRERGARCIVKRVRPDRIHRPRVSEDLLREGETLARLGHPHLVRAYETIAGPPPAIVFETLAGRTLARLIEEEDAPDRESVAHLGLQLGSALFCLHRHGIVHLDLKPSNVIVEAGRAKVIDLSIARAPGPARPGIGTWDYMAPEQARGGELGFAADVWGLGGTMFEAATGEAPYEDDTGTWLTDSVSSSSGDEELVDHPPQLERDPRRAGEVAPVDPELDDLLAACLRRDAAERPALEETLARLEELAGLEPAERFWSRYPAPAAG